MSAWEATTVPTCRVKSLSVKTITPSCSTGYAVHILLSLKGTVSFCIILIFGATGSELDV